MSLGRDRVLETLRDPGSSANLGAAGWDVLLPQARQSDLLARLSRTLDEAGLGASVLPAVRPHLKAVDRLVAAQHEEVRREVEHLRMALEPLGVPVILLKGAAYLMAGLPPAAGRLFSDVDILVPKHRLGDVETALMLHGWVTTHHSAYDQRYYREWMHELPPMEHVRRKTTLDVHHTILPETARVHPDAARLIAAAVDVPGHPGLKTLSPVDRVLHSMTHLFYNEELSHGLRDLSDLDLLLRSHLEDEAFWRQLPARAEELQLGRVLHYGLRYTSTILATPVPQAAMSASRAGAPGAVLARVMDWLWQRALRSPHAEAGDAFTPLALFALYVRAHWLRMPPVLLMRHLTIKALKLHETGETA